MAGLALGACGAQIALPDASDGSPPPVSTAARPCARSSAPCTDLYVVAHEDDDLLFMNPDIASSIEAGNHVVVVHLTAGDLSTFQASHLVDRPTAQQYWIDRERGSLNAYMFMALDEGYTAYVPGTDISSQWSAQTLTIAGVQLTEYDLVADTQSVSLVELRLSDLQLQNAWLGNPGLGGQLGDVGTDPRPPFAPGALQTVPCTGCPLGTDLPGQVLSRDQLVAVLEGLITRFTSDTAATSISFQDASGLYIDGLGTPASCNPHGHDRGRSCGYRDYWDHVYGAMFVLSAALAVEATHTAPLTLREYRDYSISQEPPTLSRCPRLQPWCDSDTTTKTQIMAYYALYDDGLVDHAGTGFTVTEPSFERAAAAFEHEHYDPVANQPPTYDDYDANAPRGWESRQVELQTIVAGTALRGRLAANGFCLGYAGTTPRPVDCASAPVWELAGVGQIFSPDTKSCLAVRADATVVLAPCTPATTATQWAMFDSHQIRTVDARCLSMTDTVDSVPCANPHDLDPASHPHAAGVPVVEQDWTLIAP